MNDYNLIPSFDEFRMMNESYLYEKKEVNGTSIITRYHNKWEEKNAGDIIEEGKERVKKLAKLAIKGDKTGKYNPDTMYDVVNVSIIILAVYSYDTKIHKGFVEYYLVWCNENGPDHMKAAKYKEGKEACIQYLNRKRKMPAMIQIEPISIIKNSFFYKKTSF